MTALSAALLVVGLLGSTAGLAPARAHGTAETKLRLGDDQWDVADDQWDAVPTAPPAPTSAA
ncbi:hypothetical protein [Streptomyces alkaliphilus]|uniref:hypothetical protein n=1 Tax=Streptomyces alkaliphilus TaxID=1472722 RepID=UPI0011816D52|nr:hypothetical protein [Streptomyces alkaliphilus]MQS08456.1 hypothetical protein [Streptomyces alkaliphilus]